MPTQCRLYSGGNAKTYAVDYLKDIFVEKFFLQF